MAASDFFEDLDDYKKKIGLMPHTASLKSTESVTCKNKKVKTKQKHGKKRPQADLQKGKEDPPKGKEKGTLEENKSDKESNRELIVKSQKIEGYRKEEINSKPIHDESHIDEWYLHDCLE